MIKAGMLIFGLFFSAIACGQNILDDDDIKEIFGGLNFDVSAAITRVETMGITPYDFGNYLLAAGEGGKAKEWYVAVGIHTKDLQYVYGLAWAKWATGDNQGAIQDASYIMVKEPTSIIQARTLYMLGAINVDEYEFKPARKYLQAGFDGYKALGKAGGQYLCLSMLAMCSVFESRLDDVEPLLESALEYNKKIKEKGKIPYSLGRYHEIIGEMRFAQGDYDGALLAAQESIQTYNASNENSLADEVNAKIGLLLLMTGEPKAAHNLASRLSETHHNSRDRGRLLAFNSITLMKLSLCAQEKENARDMERAARTWANSGKGGKALIRLLEWVKEENNVPCPEWR